MSDPVSSAEYQSIPARQHQDPSVSHSPHHQTPEHSPPRDAQYIGPVPPPGYVPPPSYTSPPQSEATHAQYEPPTYIPVSYAPVLPGQQVIISTLPATEWTNEPQAAYCSKCQHQGVSTVKRVPGLCTWLSCAGICLIGCYLGCCLIPFCVDSYQDCSHLCPNCGEFLGRKNIL